MKSSNLNANILFNISGFNFLKANPIQSFLKSYTCGEPIRNVPNGIIQSPNYPNYGNQNCAITITPPADSAIRVFIIDLSLDVNEIDLADDS